MQNIYCGLTTFNSTTIKREDSQITIYGDAQNSSIDQTFIKNLASCVNSISIIELKEITRVEDYALSNLQVSKFELILPDTLQYIGKYAFENCTAMNSIVIPSSVTYIGVGAFYNCGSLNHIYFREGTTIDYIPEQFCSGGGLNSVGIAYNDGTFTPDDTTEFPASIKTINNNAFKDCMSMGNNLIIGDSVERLGDYAFYGTIFDNITIGTGINTGDDENSSEFDDGGYTTDREITTPYTLYLSSKRQFRYKRIDITEDTPAGTIFLLNVDNYVEDESVGKSYTYKTSDDDFKFCLNSNHVLVFKNGLLLPDTYYYLHSIINNPINDVGIVINVSLTKDDYIDIFYVTNDLKHIEVDYYDMANKERYLKNGDIRVASNNATEYRNMGDTMENKYNNKVVNANYIKLRSPLYAISSKHSLFVFLNGKKVRLEELEDISDTILSISSDYARSSDVEDNTMNAVRLEVLNHLDTQDIIEQLYINDGLSHNDKTIYENQFILKNQKNVYKNTLLVNSIDLTKLESYAKRTLLDDILNDLSDENLNKLFYEYNTGQGPITELDESKMNEPDFVKKDVVINSIINKYYEVTNTSKNPINTSTSDSEVSDDDTLIYASDDLTTIPDGYDGNTET
jgi:hypothetical protein